MDPDELAAALGGQQPQSNGTNWDGRIAVNPQTGERVVYRTNPSGRGRFVALNSETADPQARERVEAIQNRADIGGRTLNQAQRFVEQNFETPTGGLQNTLEGSPRAVAAFFRPNMFSQADQLSALSNQMIGSNWQPGTSTMMNTATEQEMIRRRYPSPSAQGPANMETYLNMAEEVAVQRAAVESMRQWLGTRTNLEGWDAEFARGEQDIRRQARQQAQQQMSATQSRVRGDGSAERVRQGMRPQPSAQGQTIRIDANGRVIP